MSELKINGTGSLQDALARDAMPVQETVATAVETHQTETAHENSTADISVNQNGELQQAAAAETNASIQSNEEQVFDFATPNFGDTEQAEQTGATTQAQSALTWQDAIKQYKRVK